MAAGARIVVLGEAVQLDDAPRIDLRDLDQLVLETLLASGPLLAGIDLGANDALDRWLQDARLRVDRRVAGLLEAHAAAHERDGQLPRALQIALAVVDRTPLAEPAWVRVIRLH